MYPAHASYLVSCHSRRQHLLVRKVLMGRQQNILSFPLLSSEDCGTFWHQERHLRTQAFLPPQVTPDVFFPPLPAGRPPYAAFLRCVKPYDRRAGCRPQGTDPGQPGAGRLPGYRPVHGTAPQAALRRR